MPKNSVYPNEEKRREDWGTPLGLFNHLHSVFDFAIDLAASSDNTKLPKYIHKGTSTRDLRVLRELVGSDWCFANPPFKSVTGEMVRELDRIFSWNSVVAIIPAPICNNWFRKVFEKCTKIYLLGRIPFEGICTPAPFDVCLAIRDVHRKLCFEQRRALGEISRLSMDKPARIGGDAERKKLLDLCRR